MSQRSEPVAGGRTRSAALPDETIQQLVESVMEAVSERVGDSDDFESFERTLLEVSNEVCRQAIKKNSKR